MENNLGITAEEIAEFQDETPQGSSAASAYANKIAALTAEDLEVLLNQDEDDNWKDRIQKIARLPGIDNDVKIACMVLGADVILGQLFILHGMAEGLGAQEAIHAFGVFCEAVGIPTSQTTGWVAFYFFAGVLGNQVTESEAHNLAGMFAPTQVEAGPLAKVLSTYSAPALELLVASLGPLQPVIESLGVEFSEDEGMISEVNERRQARAASREGVVDIRSLAPDNDPK